MNCETVLERLDDYLEGVLAPGERAELERHLGDCGACRGEAEGLRALLAAARALPRALEPGGDLWPEIARRVRAGSRPPAAALPLRRPAAFSWGAIAAGAALLVLATAALTFVLTRRAGGGPVPVPAGGGTTVLASMRSERAGFLEERQRLLAAFEARKSTLQPATVAVVEKNLTIIDNALAQIDAALRRDPNNADLGTLLAGAYRQELALLGRAALMNPEPSPRVSLPVQPMAGEKSGLRGGDDHAKS